jgi:hypothetical protein
MAAIAACTPILWRLQPPPPTPPLPPADPLLQELEQPYASPFSAAAAGLPLSPALAAFQPPPAIIVPGIPALAGAGVQQGPPSTQPQLPGPAPAAALGALPVDTNPSTAFPNDDMDDGGSLDTAGLEAPAQHPAQHPPSPPATKTCTQCTDGTDGTCSEPPSARARRERWTRPSRKPPRAKGAAATDCLCTPQASSTWTRLRSWAAWAARTC